MCPRPIDQRDEKLNTNVYTFCYYCTLILYSRVKYLNTEAAKPREKQLSQGELGANFGWSDLKMEGIAKFQIRMIKREKRQIGVQVQ